MNSGQIIRTLYKHGAFWTVRFWGKDGQRRERVCPISGPGMLKKKERLAKAQAIVDAALAITPTITADTAASVTFKVAGDSWLHDCETRADGIRGNTSKLYAHYLKNWLYPVIGNVLVGQVKINQAKLVVAYMMEKKAAPSVIEKVITVLRQVVGSIENEDCEALFPVKWKIKKVLPKHKGKEMQAFTAAEIEAILRVAPGQYQVLFALLAASGLRIGEALAIEIGADKKQTTTLSADCRVVYVKTIILQDGTKQDDPKTSAGVREIDLHPEIAHMLMDFIDTRTSGFLFCSKSGKPGEPGKPLLQSNICKNIFNRILYGWEQKKMERDGTKWKCVGKIQHPGVLADGLEADGYGFHSFRRYRVTYLGEQPVPMMYQTFWFGHGKKTITEEYQRCKQKVTERRTFAETAGLGFKLPAVKVVELKSKQGVAA